MKNLKQIIGRATWLIPATVLVSLLSEVAISQGFIAKYIIAPNQQPKLLEYRESGDVSADLEQLQVERYPQFIREHHPVSGSEVIEVRSAKRAQLSEHLSFLGFNNLNLDKKQQDDDSDQVRTLVSSGPSDRRIDLVFMGDGYTNEERDKFFEDMQRLVTDMFESSTFKSYLPLFNVHAVFRASEQSGIGRSGAPKRTAYGLRREGNTLRAIFPGNMSAIRNSCSNAPGCDYPIVIANDDYYGGLGGEVAISTRSLTSGTVVLRHELGHNFGRVGEEYDGGGYFGANHSSSHQAPSWSHWLSSDVPFAQPSRAMYIGWPWHQLHNGPFVARLNSQGFNSFAIEFSSSGTPNNDDLNIELDGRNLAFQSSGADDRSFYFFPFDEQLSSGPHQLKFRASPAASNPWLSNLTAFEFGENYNFAAENVGTYPLFDKNLRVDGYRATHRSCLMRDMTKNYFCPVCQENNWIKFFSRISVIDSVSRQTTNNQQQVLTVTPLQLGQLRTGDQGRLRVTWSKDGQALEAFDDQFEIIVQNDAVTGSRIEVEVVYETPEVRRDSMNRLRDRHQWQF